MSNAGPERSQHPPDGAARSRRDHPHPASPLSRCRAARARDHRPRPLQHSYRPEDATAALAEPWAGRVFLHPHPDNAIARYQLQKLLRDYLADRVTAAVILTGRTDWLRCEPLLLSFPFLLHYKRLFHWRWNRNTETLERLNPSNNFATLYLPAKKGGHFDDDKLQLFAETFSPFGRVILAEDTGDGWEQDALLATARMPIKPLLTTVRLDRSNQRPGTAAHLLYRDEAAVPAAAAAPGA